MLSPSIFYCILLYTFIWNFPLSTCTIYILHPLFGITKAYTYITNLRVVSERLIWGKKLKQIIIMKSDITKVSIVNTTLFLVTITRSIVIKTNKKSYSVMAENTEAVAKAIQE